MQWDSRLIDQRSQSIVEVGKVDVLSARQHTIDWNESIEGSSFRRGISRHAIVSDLVTSL